MAANYLFSASFPHIVSHIAGFAADPALRYVTRRTASVLHLPPPHAAGEEGMCKVEPWQTGWAMAGCADAMETTLWTACRRGEDAVEAMDALVNYVFYEAVSAPTEERMALCSASLRRLLSMAHGRGRRSFYRRYLKPLRIPHGETVPVDLRYAVDRWSDVRWFEEVVRAAPRLEISKRSFVVLVRDHIAAQRAGMEVVCSSDVLERYGEMMSTLARWLRAVEERGRGDGAATRKRRRTQERQR